MLLLARHSARMSLLRYFSSSRCYCNRDCYCGMSLLARHSARMSLLRYFDFFIVISIVIGIVIVIVNLIVIVAYRC